MKTQKISLLLLICFMLLGISSCKKDKTEPDPVINTITKTQEVILANTIYETKAYYYTSNIKGPKVTIVGGIHGDEVAGWKAGLKLLEKEDFTGSVMIIPMANIVADNLQERYPGKSNNNVYNGISYTDLNRTFPGKVDGTATEKICYALIEVIKEFNPLYIIDLHESRRSYTSEKGLLGDTVIYNNLNSCLLADEIVTKFNSTYLTIGDVHFTVDSSSPEGAFNTYWSSYEDKFVFTFETNRELDESKRINQQLNLINILFELIEN